MKRLSLLVGVSIVLALVTACSETTSRGLTISAAWVSNAPMVDMPGAAYFVIHNNGASEDKLLSVESDIARTLEMHETRQSGGMLDMSPVSNVSIPAGGVVEFKPGSFHVMLIGLTRALKAGEKVQLTLNFEKAGKIPVTAEVREQ